MSQPQKQSPSTLQTAYDTIPYESYSYYKTQPDSLYVLGRLHGLTPPDYKKARVLELGCGGGGNLGPFAQEFPESECHGIDFSAEEINIANMFKEKLAIENVRYEARDILDMSAKKDGKYDYIMAHGILSWVPKDVQEHIYKICGEMLTDEGMAVISYNALPGWNAVRSIRDMMIYETKNCKDLKTKAARGLKMLSFIARAAPEEGAGYKKFLEFEAEIIAGAFENYVLHDHLGEFNDAFYLHEFESRIRQEGLQYICDADMTMHYIGSLKEESRAYVAGLKNRVEREQMIDFIRNQRFHTAIITKSKKRIPDAISRESIMDCYLIPCAKPKEEEPDTTKSVVFAKPHDEKQTITVHDKEASQLLIELHYHGFSPITVEDLINKTAESYGADDTAPYRQAILQQGIELLRAGFLYVFSEPAKAVNYLSEKPEAHPYAKLQVTLFPRSTRVMNTYRTMVDTQIHINYALQYCDGNHTHDEITDALMKHFEKKDFGMSDKNGLPVTDPVQVKMRLKSMTFTALNNLANAGVFVK